MSQTLNVYAPYDRTLIETLPQQGKEEVEQALARAYGLFGDQSQWLPPYQRMAILERLVSLMRGRVEALTRTAAQEGGKPWRDSEVEVHRAINGVQLAREEIARLTGTQIPMGITASSMNRLAFTMREPIGVVASVSAFNHPLNLIVHQTVTAFAAGCPVIVKPASTTPRSCLLFAELLREAGFHPLEVLTSATLNGAEALKADDRIGSIEPGKLADIVVLSENPLANLKVLYGTGHIRIDAEGEPERVGGVRYTIKDGIVFDAAELLGEVRALVAEDKQAKGIERLKQPGL
jgi:acyl-CoA reductase-like NAD-dependent aldehyde dehydrogenase